jgi:predicted DNA-binding transcriptional regulator AlpA
MGVQRQSKQEYMARMQLRYLKASKREKGRLLDEVVAVTGYHRHHAVRVLRHGRFPNPKLAAVQGLAVPRQASARRGNGRAPGRPRAYSSVVVGKLQITAEASGWLCGKRLAPFLRELVPALEAEGALHLTAEERAHLLAMSAATIDRRLRLFRLQRDPRNWHGLGTTKPGSLLKDQVPVQTYTPWEDQRPGFLEIDLVAHCGTTTEGFYLNTLVGTDVATGWTECIGVWGKSQRAVFDALKTIRARLPMRLLGLDSDNGSEFLNAHLVRYCTQEQLTFTRSRPYWKNDQAHVEQKNWSVVRRLVGYGRYESQTALVQLNRVYDLLRIWTNCWQPSLKLVAKERDGVTGKSRKRYDDAKTPYRRLLTSGVLDAVQQQALAQTFTASGPMALRRNLATAVEQLGRLQERPNALFELDNN